MPENASTFISTEEIIEENIASCWFSRLYAYAILLNKYFEAFQIFPPTWEPCSTIKATKSISPTFHLETINYKSHLLDTVNFRNPNEVVKSQMSQVQLENLSSKQHKVHKNIHFHELWHLQNGFGCCGACNKMTLLSVCVLESFQKMEKNHLFASFRSTVRSLSHHWKRRWTFCYLHLTIFNFMKVCYGNQFLL